ncbi:auxin response factor 7-like isoform X2 [Curcuma longa]|uniref:auxin response factor 7-like isoform X2 n=1 Tax=Curcuma longa TaxID=136217 RepID=UPI003D9DBD04
MFSFSGSQRVPELFTPSKPHSVLSSASNASSSEFATKISPPQNEALSVNINKESCDKKHETSKGCRLFGIQLTKGRHQVQETLSVPTIRGIGVDQPVTSLDSEQQSQPSNLYRSGAPAVTNEAEKCCLRLSREMQNRQFRSCTKVHMQGIAVGRAVDLTRLCGYAELLQKLEDMFNIKQELTTALKKWVVVYTDDEKMMTVGDDPWPMVRKIYIYTPEEAKQLLSPKRKLPVLTDADRNYLADEGNAGVA